LVPQIYDAAPFLFNPHAQNLTAGSIVSPSDFKNFSYLFE
jgi:hypothetical protein